MNDNHDEQGRFASGGSGGGKVGSGDKLPKQNDWMRDNSGARVKPQSSSYSDSGFKAREQNTADQKFNAADAGSKQAMIQSGYRTPSMRHNNVASAHGPKTIPLRFK